MMDEIPMIFLVIQLLINALNVKSKFIKTIAYCYSCVYSWYIYMLSQTDNPVNEFYIFQASIIFFAIVILISFIKSNIRGRNKLLQRGVFLFLTGYTCWLIDFFMCNYINQYIQFHSLWHIFSAIGLYFISKYSLIICN